MHLVGSRDESFVLYAGKRIGDKCRDWSSRSQPFPLVIPLSRKIFCEGTGAGSGKFALVIRSRTDVSSVSSVVEVGLSTFCLL